MFSVLIFNSVGLCDSTNNSAKTCELMGSFQLSQLQDLNINAGLYQDNRLAFTNATPRDTENIKKEIYPIFNNNGLHITTSSLRLLSVDSLGWQMIRNFSLRQRLHLLLERLYSEYD